ncbi:MAG: hypothetical protein HFH49_04435 [Lachnospiraceae bacterium]|nr:hypothetical protein [Lachnospiraceae bacterium]
MKKTNISAKIITFFLLLTLSLSQAAGTVQAAGTRPSNTKKPESGNVFAGVSGTFERVEKAKILKRINEIRKEACVNGYPNPSTERKLTPSDYRPMKWSSNLELVALLRAAESAVNESHTRPNGQSCFSISYHGEQSRAENLAWNNSGLMYGIEQWYEEKNDWITGNANAVTGHYESLINPAYQFIGLGSFRRSTGGWYGVSAEFSSSTAGSQAQSKLKGKKVQTIEVSKKSLSNPSLNAPAKLKVKKTKKLTVSCDINYPGIMGGTNTSKGRILKGVTWKSSKPSVLQVNSSGKITAKKAGKATITAKVKGGFSVKKTITVTK